MDMTQNHPLPQNHRKPDLKSLFWDPPKTKPPYALSRLALSVSRVLSRFLRLSLSSRRVTSHTEVLIADQCLRRIEYLHSLGRERERGSVPVRRRSVSALRRRIVSVSIPVIRGWSADAVVG